MNEQEIRAKAKQTIANLLEDGVEFTSVGEQMLDETVPVIERVHDETVTMCGKLREIVERW